MQHACSLPFASPRQPTAMPCYAMPATCHMAHAMLCHAMLCRHMAHGMWQPAHGSSRGSPSLLSPSPCTAWLIRGAAAASEFWPLEATKTADLSLGYASSVLTLRRPKDAHLVLGVMRTHTYKVPEHLINAVQPIYRACARLAEKSRCLSEADPVGGNPAAWRGPHRGTFGPSPPPSGRGPIERTRADAPHLRRHLRKAHAASPRGVAHGRGPRLAPGLLRARG